MSHHNPHEPKVECIQYAPPGPRPPTIATISPIEKKSSAREDPIPSRHHHPACSAHYGMAASHTACPPTSPSTYDACSKLQPDSTLLSPHPQSQCRVSLYSRSHSPSPTVVSSNNGASLFIPPSPTLSTQSSVHFTTSLSLRDNKPDERNGYSSLHLLSSPMGHSHPELICQQHFHVHLCTLMYGHLQWAMAILNSFVNDALHLS
ncbi:hypothetical protein P692DRAFT_20830864 [Suillus brevipes Sb2]|nr:hypothetical protein P692DRAFT_20830864 [Suillus brevipes Sb2]